jgi:hypothetical protein
MEVLDYSSDTIQGQIACARMAAYTEMGQAFATHDLFWGAAGLDVRRRAGSRSFDLDEAHQCHTSH